MKVLREPLVQFLVLGIVIFAVNAYVLKHADDPRRIVVDNDTRDMLIDIFKEGKGRAPNNDELDELVVVWTQNEILYREARLMGLDKGDEMIRQRLILKMRNVLFSTVTADPPTDEQLLAWFELNRERYDTPERFDVEQFKVADVGDTQGEVAAQALASRLKDSPPPQEYESRLRTYQRRQASNVSSMFGDDALTLLDGPENNWHAVMSEKGWHVARITQRYPSRAADFESIRGKVAKDWKSAAERLELADAVNEIAEQYQLKLAFDHHDVEAGTLQDGDAQQVSMNNNGLQP